MPVMMGTLLKFPLCHMVRGASGKNTVSGNPFGDFSTDGAKGMIGSSSHP